MKNDTVLENLQKIIETAEIISSVILEEAMEDNWVQESIDNSLGELEKTTAYLRDKYDLDVFDFDDEEYLSNTEFDDEDPFLDDETDELEDYSDLDFGEDDEDEN